MLENIIAENLCRWINDSKAAPVQLSISPTNICNLKCQSCWQRDYDKNSRAGKEPKELPKEKLFDVIRQAKGLGIRCIEITGGGEPLARKDTFFLMKEIKKTGMIGWMTTNGTLFTPETIRLTVEMGWDKLTISLDGPDAETNDFLRPPAGTFARIIKTLKEFKEYKNILQKNTPDITFNVVVSKPNINKLPEFIKIAAIFGVAGVTFEPVKVYAKDCERILLDFEADYDFIKSKLNETQEAASRNNVFTNIDGLINAPELIKYSGNLRNRLTVPVPNKHNNKFLNVPCIEPWFHIFLEVDGNVRPCCVSSGLGENVNCKSLREIWLGERFSSFRNAIIEGKYPRTCEQCNANLICFSKKIQELLKEKLFTRKGVNKGMGSKKDILKLLITDTAYLYPPLWGGPKRIWNLYANFNQDKFDITYAGVHFNLGKDLKYGFKKLKDNFREILCGFPAHYYFWHIFEKIFFKNTSLDLFLYLFMHTDWHFKHILNSQDADIIVCSHPWASLSCRKTPGQFFIYDAHNCEYLLMKQILGKHWLKNIILRQVKKIEGDACRKSDLILACSEKEKQDIEILYGADRRKFIVVPNGTSVVEQTDNRLKQECRIDMGLSDSDKVALFVGAYYKPNNEAALFIVNKIAPVLKDFKFLIIGTAGRIFEDTDVAANVKCLGQLPDADFEKAMRAADIAINPIFKGSGVNIKMLDYMSYGLPIVTTQCGARGIQMNGKMPMFLSSPERFCQDISMLYENKVLRLQMSEAGRQLAAEQYDWQKISANLQGAILQRMEEKAGYVR